MGKLSTHVLDTSIGKPAVNMSITLYKKVDNTYIFVKKIVTNDDGRSDEPLLSQKDFEKGGYELVFDVLNYFISRNIETPFLQDVVIRFYVDDSAGNFHVPLLITPFSYSTYKGS